MTKAKIVKVAKIMNITKIILCLMILLLIISCQIPTEETPTISEEQEVTDGLEDLDELDQLIEGLDEDITLRELDDLGLE